MKAVQTSATAGAMRNTHLAVGAGTGHGADAAAMLGQPLTLLFALEADDEGALPILTAAAEQTRFDGQIAELRGTGQRVRISASPRIDALGRFAGFSGAAVMVDPAEEAAMAAQAGDPRFTSEFGQRLEECLEGLLAGEKLHADRHGPEGPFSQARHGQLHRLQVGVVRGDPDRGSKPAGGFVAVAPGQGQPPEPNF